MQTGEGALNETHDILQRMRELSVQGGNSTLNADDRTAITDEVTALNAELDRIGNSTQFNGTFLLKGDLGGRTIGAFGAGGADLTGANGLSGITASGTAKAATYTVAVGAVSGGASDLTISDTLGNSETVHVAVPTSGSATIEFKNLGLNISVNNALGSTALTAADDTDFTVAVANGLTLQIGANNDAAERMDVTGINDMRSTGLGVNAVAVGTVAQAQSALTLIDTAINSVNSARGKFGAFQNRLEHTVNNLGVSQENLAASESRIRDADVAKEMANLTRSQIMQQAAQGMLSQANQGAQSALTLLRG